MKKKLLSFLSTLVLLSAITVPAFAEDAGAGYHESLNYIGISLDDFIRMPEGTKSQWKNVVLEIPEKSTRYFLIDSEKEAPVEVSFSEFIASKSNNHFSRAATDTTRASWVTVTASISKASTGDYAISGNAALVSGTGAINKLTHTISIETNRNTSIVANSELFKHTYTLQGNTHTENIWTANAGRNPYMYTFKQNIHYGATNQTLFMALRAKPNVSNLTVMDGIVHFGRFESTIDPSVAFYAQLPPSVGASITFDISTSFVEVTPAHAQISI